MKKQILFSIALLITIASIPSQAAEGTVTGKSTWTIIKGVAKIIIGAKLTLAGVPCLIIGIPTLGIGLFSGNQPKADHPFSHIGNKDDFVVIGGVATLFGSAATAGGIALLYSGTNDLNENEDQAWASVS